MNQRKITNKNSTYCVIIKIKRQKKDRAFFDFKNTLKDFKKNISIVKMSL